MRLEKDQKEKGDKEKPYYVTTGKPWRTHGGMDGRPVPYFSDNISAAWEVVEKMGSDPKYGNMFAVFLFKQPQQLNRKGWDKRGVGYNEGGMLTFAPTAPLAICRAALKATCKD